ncbi:MAG TPA: hypothetical protein VF190_02550 [Rhodothermales bacterium]
MHRAIVFLMLLGAVAAIAPRPVPGQAPPRCDQEPIHRQFDFWIGEWDVFNPDGEHLGRNRIERTAAGCALIETWKGDRGGTGNSINYFDPERQKWVQTWVGGSGYVIDVAGEFVDGSMRLEGRYVQTDGTVQPFRGIWTPLKDGRIRQLLETSTDSGATFETWFDGYYVRTP